MPDFTPHCNHLNNLFFFLFRVAHHHPGVYYVPMKKNENPNPTMTAMVKAARKAARDQEIRTGIRPRSNVFADRKKVNNKNACRGRVTV